MSFRDCVKSARDQGELSAEEAADLLRRYEAHRRAKLGDAQPDEAAKAALAKELDEASARKRWLADLAAAKQAEIVAHLRAYRTPDGAPDVYEGAMRLLENFGYSGTSSVTGRAKSIVSLIHGEMADVLRKFERNAYTGLRHNQVGASDLVHDILGEATGKPEVAAMADAVRTGFERLRERFNAAGGAIGKIEGGYLPQAHDAGALLKAGYDAWRAFIRPRLDVDRMRDPLTGGPLSAERLDESLRASFNAITTDGWAGRTPTMARQGVGALANQRADHRFLHFKSAADWLDYDRQFGSGDPIKAIFQHVNGMARDVAALEVLGPNPGATVEWLKQVVLSEHAKGVTGEGGLFRGLGEEDGRIAAQRVEDLWQWVRGRSVVSQQVTDFFGTVRNLLTSIQLGAAAITAATTDPAIERAARQALGMSDRVLFGSNAKVYFDTLAQMPIVRHMAPVIDYFTGRPRAEALRAGMIADEFLHIMGDEARYAGTLGGSVWSRWLADRTVTLSGLTPLTESRKAVFHLELQGFVADHSARAFTDLPERLRIKMEGYGFTSDMWDAMRSVPHYTPDRGAAGFLRPIDVAAKDRAVAERYIEFILGETERAVPSGTLRSKAYVLGGGPKGQAAKDLLDSFLQYRSFGLSFLTLQWETLARESGAFGKVAGASYAAQTLILLTLGGAVGLQLRQIAQGRDPQKMDGRFMLAAAAQGGGFGLVGDFLFAEWNRFGQSAGEQIAGPTVGLYSDIAKLTLGNLRDLVEGKNTNAGKEAVTFAARYTPVVSSLWQTRLLYRRELLDQLQYQIDPHAHRRWREEERKALRERGQGYWWQPGATAPDRFPELSTAVGR